MPAKAYFCLLALVTAACAPPTNTGLPTGLVERAALASFDAEIAPQIASVCTPSETTTLRNVMAASVGALNTGDVGAILAQEGPLRSLTPACRDRFTAVSQEYCARNAINSAPAGTPSDLVRARAQECFR